MTLAGGTGIAANGGLKLQIGDTNDAWNQLELSIDDMHVSSLGIGDIDISTRLVLLLQSVKSKMPSTRFPPAAAS